MIRRLLCWLGDILGKDWHEWEFESVYAELENSNAVVEIYDYSKRFCKHCGKIKK